jgi:hypothetical protein
VTVCPIAIVAGCRKCPAFSVCPLKSVIGDQKAAPQAKTTRPPPSRNASASGASRLGVGPARALHELAFSTQPASLRIDTGFLRHAERTSFVIRN